MSALGRKEPLRPAFELNVLGHPDFWPKSQIVFPIEWWASGPGCVPFTWVQMEHRGRSRIGLGARDLRKPNVALRTRGRGRSPRQHIHKQ